MLVVKFVKREFNVFLLLGGEFFYGFALENIEQRAAGEYESSAEFHSLFGVLLFFGFLLFFRNAGFFYVENIVYGVGVFIRYRVDIARFRLFGKLFFKLVIGVMNIFRKTEYVVIYTRNRLEFHGVVGYNLMLFVAVHSYVNFVDAAVLYKFGLLGGNNFALLYYKFAVLGYNILVSGAAYRSHAHIEAFVEFISAYLCAIVSSRIVEKIFELLTNGVLGGNFAGADSSV